MSQEYRDRSSRRINFVAIGVGAGMAVGSGVGMAVGNVDFAMALGVLLGATIGALFNLRK